MEKENLEFVRGMQKEQAKLYKWIREKNSHTPDDVIDYMWQAVKDKLSRDMVGGCPECLPTFDVIKTENMIDKGV